MEGVPRMPMLSIECKICAAPTDLATKIYEYIERRYHEDPSKYDRSIEEILELRENACRAAMDLNGCKTLKRYFAQLHLLKSRFPMEQGDAVAVSFTWFDKFSDMPNSSSCEDVRFEMACVLHNIGCAHSHIASAQNRVSAEGMKCACTHYQHAAFAFQQLRDRHCAAVFSIDFDKTLLTWYHGLMLAQAQECILEKSMVDNRRHNIVAKVAIQVAEFYQICCRTLDAPQIPDIIGSSKTKTWKKFCQMKDSYYTSIAYLYMGQNASENKMMGERISWYQEAEKKMKEALKLASKEKKEVQEALGFLKDVVTAKLDNAKKENDFIFHERVPTLDSLPEIPKASLVKGIEFDPLDPAVSGPDIFGALVPLDIHQANSLYSEEKADLLRKLTDKVTSHDNQLKSFLDSLDVGSLGLWQESEQLPVPDVLLERSAAFNAQPGAVPELMVSLNRITSCYQEAERKLHEVDDRSKALEKLVLELKGKIPKESLDAVWNRLSETGMKLARFRDAHTRATLTNTELHKAIASHSSNLHILSLPLSELLKQLPHPELSPGKSPEGERLRTLLDKVEEMQKQRVMLVEQLRQQLHADDLTKHLLAEKDMDTKEIFDRELKKHDKQVGIVEQNLKAQENILNALTDANAQFAHRRKETAELMKSRDEEILALVAAYDVYSDVVEKAEKGRQFYEKLLENLREDDDGLDQVEEKFEELKKKAEAAEQEKASRPPPPLPAVTPAAGGETKTPRLQEYMEYYRAKKAGLSVPPPQSLAPTSNGFYQGPGVCPPVSSVQAQPPIVSAAAVPTPSPSQPPFPSATAAGVPMSQVPGFCAVRPMQYSTIPAVQPSLTCSATPVSPIQQQYAVSVPPFRPSVPSSVQYSMPSSFLPSQQTSTAPFVVGAGGVPPRPSLAPQPLPVSSPVLPGHQNILPAQYAAPVQMPQQQQQAGHFYQQQIRNFAPYQMNQQQQYFYQQQTQGFGWQRPGTAFGGIDAPLQTSQQLPAPLQPSKVDQKTKAEKELADVFSPPNPSQTPLQSGQQLPAPLLPSKIEDKPMTKTELELSDIFSALPQ